jgi:hypothetical protein
MTQQRRIKRRQEQNGQEHLAALASLCGEYYEFLSSTPRPSDNTVREQFTSTNNRWKKYCKIHKLMNVDHLFALNVREAWKRHTQLPLEN